MNRVIKSFIYFFFLVFTFLSYGQDTRDTFFNANVYYDRGEYAHAAELYEDLIAQGIRSGNVYYNLGNAYYKLGKIGKAILNYERAAAYIPHSEDLFANMAFARAGLNFKQPKEEVSLPRRIWLGLRDYFSINFWFFAGGLFFILCCFGVGAAFISPRFRSQSKIAAIVCMFIFIVCFALFFDTYQSDKRYEAGIVVADAPVRYSPSFSGAVGFNITEGMKARILRVQGDWTHIRLNKEKSGWIESAAIEPIRKK